MSKKKVALTIRKNRESSTEVMEVNIPKETFGAFEIEEAIRDVLKEMNINYLWFQFGAVETIYP